MPHFLLCHHSALIFLNLEMLRHFYHNRIFLLIFLLLCCFPISPHIRNLLLLSFWEKPWTGRQCGNKNVRLLYRQGSLPGGKKKKGERERKSTKHLKKNMTFLKILSGKEKMKKLLFLGSPNTRGHQMEFSGNADKTNEKMCLFTQCTVRLGSSLPQEKDAKIVCGFRWMWIPNQQHRLKLEKKSGKRHQGHKYQDPNQFV